MPISKESFVEIALQNPVNRELLERLPKLGLHQCYLTAGCLYQTVWNHRSKQPLNAHIKDYDIFYFDHDPSWEAEDKIIKKVWELTRDLNVSVEVKNQARVHLWYEKHFGVPCLPLKSATVGIDRFPVRGTCIGINVSDGELYAPFGMQDIWDGVLRANPNNPNGELFCNKARAYQQRWPWLVIESE